MRLLNLFLLFFFLFSINSYSLPQCEGNDATKWNNCKGTYTWADGDIYVGGWKDTKFHGQGTYTLADGTKYVGEWKDGKRHGQGTLTFVDGKKYVGEWKDGTYHGQGTYTFANGQKYVGEFKDAKYHGKGTMTLVNGSKHVGEWKDGKRHGKGTLTYSDGSRVKGTWIEGKLQENKVRGECEGNDNTKWNNCFGTFTWADGNKYVGEWKDGKRHGQGTFTWADGLFNKYVGKYKDGRWHGQGTLTFADGSIYVGEFKDSQTHGQGTLTFADGTKFAGTYVKGSFQPISSDAMEGLSDAYLMYNLYDQYCGEYVSSSKLKKALKRFIKVTLDIERKRGLKFNEEVVKDIAFQQASNNAKKERHPMNLQLRLSYHALISKKGESAACADLRALQVNQINEFSRLFELTVKGKEELKKERKRDF